MMPGQMATAGGQYDAFAPYYDDFTASSDYEAWTRGVLALAERLGLQGRTLLDLACGTGKSFMPFLSRGFEVTGCDISSAMLAEAARKTPEATLIRADLRDLGRIGRFDLITCFDDSLNYLLDERELARALSSIAANLGEMGIALFDLNTLLAYRTTFARDSVAIRDGTVFTWRGGSTADAAPGCEASAWIDVFSHRHDRLYERISTRHVQRHFPSARVTALLAAAGLACVGVHGAREDGTLDPELDEARHLKALYAARHAKGGDSQ